MVQLAQGVMVLLKAPQGLVVQLAQVVMVLLQAPQGLVVQLAQVAGTFPTAILVLCLLTRTRTHTWCMCPPEHRLGAVCQDRRPHGHAQRERGALHAALPAGGGRLAPAGPPKWQQGVDSPFESVRANAGGEGDVEGDPAGTVVVWGGEGVALPTALSWGMALTTVVTWGVAHTSR